VDRAAETRPYLSGLRLAGRRVVVVGGGVVATRRALRLLASGADLVVVSPQVSGELARLADEGRLRWLERGYQPGDLAGAWYALAATDDETTNRAVSAEAEEVRVFCVRADRAEEATAWTPASGEVDGLQVAVLAGRNPREAARVRDLLVGWLARLRRSAA
jgi:siroheme synthase-like protein